MMPQVAVTPGNLEAGVTFGSYDSQYTLKLMGDRRRRLESNTRVCPDGQFMKVIKTCVPQLKFEMRSFCRERLLEGRTKKQAAHKSVGMFPLPPSTNSP